MTSPIRALVLTGFFLCTLFQQAEAGGLSIYYIRHAESGHNALKKWKDTPKEQWPSYVGNEDAFSDLGKQQQQQVPAKLQKYHFDFIAVSPLWRTRNTILPYLQAANKKAEIWPELQETVKCSPAVIGEDVPAPSVDLFYGGPLIVLSPEDQSYFSLRADASNQCRASREGMQAERDANSMATAAIALVKKRFGGTSTAILLVGHGNAGANFFHALTGNYANTIGIANTGVWMAEEQPDGSFKIRIANDVPVDEAAGLLKK